MYDRVPFFNAGDSYAELKAEIDANVHRVLSSGWYILGPEVDAFEAEWAAYCGSDHAIGVGNGLDALTLALRALEVGAGDEVIVPAHTFIATWLAVTALGAIPVPVDPPADQINVTASSVKQAITARTKAIVLVHLYGHPVDMDPMLELAKNAAVPLVEDAAQAHGARYKGRRIGAHGDLVCWSFYPTKNLGALGDAGAVTTNDPDLAARVRRLRNYGSDVKYLNGEMGVNSRLDPVQAAVLRAKLPHLDRWNDARRLIAARYNKGLGSTKLCLPDTALWADPVWHVYALRLDARDSIAAKLSRKGISTLIHYPVAPHMQTAFAWLKIPPESLPQARRLAGRLLSLPMGPHLTQDEQSRVIACLNVLTSDIGNRA